MNKNRLTKVFCNTFEDDTIVLRRDLRPRDVKNWDSFNHINLMIAVENEFDVILQPKEVHEARSVGELVDLLKTKGCKIKI